MRNYTKTRSAGLKNADSLTDIVQRKTPVADTDILDTKRWGFKKCL